MQKEQKYDFRKKLLRVHQPDLLDPDRKKKENEFLLQNGAAIQISAGAGEVMRTGACDFVDFLKTSMGVSAYVRTADINGKEPEVTVEFAKDAGVDLGEVSSYKGFLICTDAKGIRIFAFDERGAAQALYYLEDLMCFESAPVIPFGEVRKKPMFSPQMVHSAYAMDEFPEDYLARIAHEGRDAILVFTKGANLTPCGYQDFNALIKRAGRYGLDVYAYSRMVSNMTPEAPEAEAFYEKTYGTLFRECPGLKGVTLVGESVEFPSRDPHVAKGRYFETAVDGIPADKPSSGWFPCCDYPVWLNLLKKIIRKYKPDADIVFWSYNWSWQPEEERLKLIEALPEDITLQATFEMSQLIDYEKTMGRCSDYTLAYEGPSPYFKSEAAAAHKKGIRLYSMTNTGGRTWDFGTAPYEPMPYQWIRRYEAMQKAHDDWGLCGIMETHHYGFTPSFITKLSKHCFLEPREDMKEVLKKILISQFGTENLKYTNRGLELFSEGIRYMTPSDSDQYGAYRVGPAHPFCLSAEIKIPEEEGAMFGNRIWKARYRNVCDWRIQPLGMRIKEEIARQRKMLALFEEGVAVMEKAPAENENLAELINLCRFLVNCVRTGIHAKEWHVLLCRMNLEESYEGMTGIFNEMETLLKEEIQIAKDTIPLVEMDSSLGFECSMLYMTDKWHLEWKIRQVQYVLDIELEKYRQGLSGVRRDIRVWPNNLV